jgi:uncharacterized protein (TIGR03435 family)
MAVLCGALCGALCGPMASTALSQTVPGTTPLAFEVASIRPSEPIKAGGMGTTVFIKGGVKNDGSMVSYVRMTLKSLVQTAYGVKDYQVTGAPWMDQLQFDISAKMPDGATKDQAPEMLQTLLQERFHLTVHRDKKDHPIYALVAAKNGTKLKAAEVAAAATGKEQSPAPAGSAKSGVGNPMSFSMGKMNDERAAGFAAGMAGAGRGGLMMRMGPDGAHLTAKAMTLTRFAETLSGFLDRPVMDETGIEGSYDFALDMSPAEMGNMSMMKGAMEMARTMNAGAMAPGSGGGLPNAPEGGSIFQSIQGYGLKLEPKKAAMDVIVIDGGEKTPTEN